MSGEQSWTAVVAWELSGEPVTYMEGGVLGISGAASLA